MTWFGWFQLVMFPINMALNLVLLKLTDQDDKDATRKVRIRAVTHLVVGAVTAGLTMAVGTGSLRKRSR